jgi:hypothetical protein
MSVIFNPASVTGGGGMSIGGAITGGTPNSVLFVGPGGVLSQDNANLNWTDSTTTLGVNGTSNFTGALTGPTVAGTDNSTNVATTAFVKGLGYQTGNQVITLSGDVTGSGATAITTSYAGNLPTSKLNSGTGASSTTFWRGDGTWATPAGGGGGGMSIGGAVTGGTAGSVLYIDGSSNLAQDNTNFLWDDTGKDLKLGSSGTNATLFLNTLPAMFEIPNASGNNWFEGNSGNTTLTGYGNFGTGDQALSGLTTGVANTAIGSTTLQTITTGGNNTALGYRAANNLVSGDYNFAIGTSSLFQLTTGAQNVAMGHNSLSKISTTSACLAIGFECLRNLVDTSLYNSFLGIQAGFGWTSGQSNTVMGAYAAYNITGGNNNTLIGAWEGPSASVSNVIAITDGHATNSNFSVVQGVDYNYTAPTTWSFQNLANKIGLHIYNTTDGLAPPTNYERAILDWNATANVFRIGSQAGGTGTVRLIAIDGFQKAGAPAAGDLPSGTMALINDTSGGATWLCYNAAGTLRKVQLT